MKLIPITANMTELQVGNINDSYLTYDLRILFSYQTPVAYSYLTSKGRQYFYTKEKYSKTTTKHINSWLPKAQAEEVEQYVIDDVVNGNGH